MAEPLPQHAKVRLDLKLSSPWFNAVQQDVLSQEDPTEILALGEAVTADLLRRKPRWPLVREMIEASPAMQPKVAEAVDSRRHAAEDIFRICGEAVVLADSVVIEV